MTTAKSDYQVHPYLSFHGRCEEAIEFYKKTLGAEVLMLMRVKDAPPGVLTQPMPPGWDNKVMHARIAIGQSIIMLAEGCPDKQPEGGFSLSLTVPNPAEAEKVFRGLSDGGQVMMPLAKTFFSPAFGLLKDRFGVSWMVYVQGASPS